MTFGVSERSRQVRVHARSEPRDQVPLRCTGLCTAEYCNSSELRLDLKIVAGSEQRCHIAIFEAVHERKLGKGCALREYWIDSVEDERLRADPGTDHLAQHPSGSNSALSA